LTRILLVEPDFPIPPKSKNHKNFLPIGLLKIGNWLKQEGHQVILVRGNLSKKKISQKFGHNKNVTPDLIYITSLFTYWSEMFWNSVEHYRRIYSKSQKQPIMKVGGIYVSLFYRKKEFIKRRLQNKIKSDDICKGIIPSAEKAGPDYSLLNNGDIDYQIIHTSRGCIRKCKFCGTHIIESGYTKKNTGGYYKVDDYDYIVKKTIIEEVKKHYPKQKRLIFYDNNLLLNHPFIENILNEIIEFNNDIVEKNKKLRKKKPKLVCESQSGFDGRVLLDNPEIAYLIKGANFRNVRIAWDNELNDKDKIYIQLKHLNDAGYAYKDIFVFMLYNWTYPFELMEEKRKACWEWNVQIADCRFRPLDREHEIYKPKVDQNKTDEYFIHENWTDEKVKQFRRNVRRQNICVRQNKKFYSKSMEHKGSKKNKGKNYRPKEVNDKWFPEDTHYPEDDLYYKRKSKN